MSPEEKLTEAFRMLLRKEPPLLPGVVRSVDEINMLCAVELLGSGIINDGIRLRASAPQETPEETPEGYYLVPAVNSIVHIAFLDGETEGCVLVTDQVAKVLYINGDMKLEMDVQGIRKQFAEDNSASFDATGSHLKTGSSQVDVLADLISLVSGGKVEIRNDSKNLKDIIAGLIAIVSRIVVVQGVGPDIPGLQQLNADLNQLM